MSISINTMYIIAAFLLSAGCGLVMIPALLRFCQKRKLYDLPDARKVHHILVPRLGGTAFMPSMALSAIIVIAVMSITTDSNKIALSTWSLAMILSAFIIYSVGVVDDLIGLNAKVKFVMQISASAIIPCCGLWINNLYGLFGIHEIPAFIGMPLTVLLFVFIDNAFNLIDGIDGLAASLAILALVGFIYCFSPYDLIAYEVMIAGMIGILVSYLKYNLWGNAEKGKKIFMGDSGSLTLGFILAFLFVKAIAVNPNVMPMSTRRVLVAYSLLIVPTFDVVRVVLHRLRWGKPIFDADKCHIHHKLMELGLSQHQTLLSILFLAVAYIAINLMMFDLCGLNLTFILIVDIIIYTIFHICISKRLHVQRAVDIILSMIALVIFSPAFLIIAIAIRHEDGMPVIYKQERIGLNGKPFFIYKFRSMKVDAEKDGPNLLEIAGDKRLTKVGAFLRSHHLDELPQLWNVLKGDMAFIGPRPERKFYIDQIMEHDSRYTFLYQIRPGVTSYATLYNGYTDTMEKMLRRLELDLYYLEHRSWWFDTKILIKTFLNIVFGKKF